MRSRFSDGVVIVLAGLALLTVAVRALPAPPDLRASLMNPELVRVHLSGPAPHRTAALTSTGSAVLRV